MQEFSNIKKFMIIGLKLSHDDDDDDDDDDDNDDDDDALMPKQLNNI